MSVNAFANTENQLNLSKNNVQLDDLINLVNNTDNTRIIKYDDFTVKITTVEDNSADKEERHMMSKGDPSYDSQNTILTIISGLLTRQFIMTQHALQRLEERFAGDYYKIAQALTKGKIYLDNKYGGYIAYYKGVVVSLADDKQTIKTVIDNVSLWSKLKYSIWSFFQSAYEFFWK